MKTKLSVTVEAHLVEELDRLVEGSSRSRSRVVEEALAHWLREIRGRALDSAIERYYCDMTDGGRSEDEAWAELGHSAIGESWS